MYTLEQVLQKTFNIIKDEKPHTFFLYGDLGVGKTHFVKNIARLLKVNDNITSPTFVILRDYTIPNDTRKLVHADFYRFKGNISLHLLDEVALFDYLFYDIVFIEWADLIERFLPDSVLKNVIRIKINKDLYGTRTYEFL